MNTKVIYVLVSTEKDVYLEQALLSIYTLRQHNTNVNISVLIDDVTEKSLIGERSKLRNVVDNIVVGKRGDALSAKESASSLKTTFRERMQGDVIFIDTDTIITGDLSVIDNCPFDVGAVPDAHLSYGNHFNHLGYKKLFESLGVVYEGDKYYNSGVLYVKDSEEGHRLCNEWKKSYSEQHSRCFYDQPHLAIADNKCHVIHEIGGEWNCQIVFGIKFLSNAKIIHYFASNFVNGNTAHPYSLMGKEIFLKIKDAGCEIPEDIKNLVAHPELLWNDKTEIVGGMDVDLQHSQQMKIMRTIFYKHNKLFNKIEDALNFFAQLKH